MEIVPFRYAPLHISTRLHPCQVSPSRFRAWTLLRTVLCCCSFESNRAPRLNRVVAGVGGFCLRERSSHFVLSSLSRFPLIKPVEISLELESQDGRLEPCEWCVRSVKRPIGEGTKRIMLSQDLDLFNKKLALRSLIGALWLFFSPLNVSSDQAGLVLGVDHRTV